MVRKMNAKPDYKTMSGLEDCWKNVSSLLQNTRDGVDVMSMGSVPYLFLSNSKPTVKNVFYLLMSRRNQMLTVLKDVHRETITTTTEVVSTVKVLIVHIDTSNSWLSVCRTVSVTSSGLASVVSVIHMENVIRYTHSPVLF